MRKIEVVAAILTHQNRVFCAQRPNKGETALKWEFPGGKIEPGENPETALTREIFEELGVRIAIGNYLMTVAHRYLEFDLTMHVYWARILSGSIYLHEHLASNWLDSEELDSLDWAPADLPIVTKILEINAQNKETSPSPKPWAG